MLGTIVNTSTIVVGSFAGALLKKGIKEKYKSTIMQALGLVAISLGITWIVKNLSQSKEPLLFIVSLVLGGFVGEILDIELKINKLADRFKKSDENGLIEGLTTAVLLFCVGTMSILGPLESALRGDNTLLFTNALLDGITSLILASTFGIGIALSALILFIWQGSIYLSAQIIAPFVTPEILGQVSIIGGILIFSTGINILEIKKIKTINLLPALFITMIYYFPFINNSINKIANLLN
ncbi:MAG: DUF554 domain-containing protein [Anaeromicrobium sp.]|jgi:uncharacterized membrane protein YqgA involved in biofilm formation|uniref:DUF554 domain-containing protein n=1 Tax=Anaeromicrobium sp. TaxID=1929132 RepID=UPI0025DDF6A0|nr:DUF554 domain-containing protein [Anaeromicrobium sp.]MCT4592964.1 DUF554 domain-containing protein [Anaeromicrobium sp.]